MTVRDSRPVRAILTTDDEAIAASNENALDAVPTTDDTVNWSSNWPCAAAGTAGDLHCALDADVHVAVEHAAVCSAAVAVKSCDPKFKPLTLMLAPPLAGALRFTKEMTPASKLTSEDDVPTSPPTVNAGVEGNTATGMPAQRTSVAVVHDEVAQEPRCRYADSVALSAAKLRPSMLSDATRLNAILGNAEETIGASNV